MLHLPIQLSYSSHPSHSRGTHETVASPTRRHWACALPKVYVVPQLAAGGDSGLLSIPMIYGTSVLRRISKFVNIEANNEI
jgi:hypothetical protein